MLQLSNVELADFVDAEIEQNPLLEPGERDADEAPAAAPDPIPAEANGHAVALPEELGGALAGDLAGDTTDHWRVASGEEGDGSLDRGGDSQPWQIRNGGRDDEDMRGIDQAAARPRTLREHLLEQIEIGRASCRERV